MRNGLKHNQIKGLFGSGTPIDYLPSVYTYVHANRDSGEGADFATQLQDILGCLFAGITLYSLENAIVCTSFDQADALVHDLSCFLAHNFSHFLRYK